MFRSWITLAIIVLLCIPVYMDATILHVAIPTLSTTLAASGQQLLWIIDIYPLTMAGFVLPMGALGDRIGFKRLLMAGGLLFALASLIAALANTPTTLIAARVLMALGAAMLLPATLAGIRYAFSDSNKRDLALGVWTAAGCGSAAFGPLLGGWLLEHFHWGWVFLINLPIVAIGLVLAVRWLPAAPQNRNRPLNLGHALLLTSAILLLVFGAKTALKGHLPLLALVTLAAGALLLLIFIRLQQRSRVPLLDLSLFGNRIILCGVVMAMMSMVALLGFELLMSQELQFVHGLSPFAAGSFMLPVMLASGCSGPLAGLLMPRLGLRTMATFGLALAALSFSGLALTDLAQQRYWAWGWMTLLGFSLSCALLAGTSAIMSAAPEEKASSAGAIETVAYELGAGMGIALFGLLLGRIYQATIVLPAELAEAQREAASSSIAEAVQVASTLPAAHGSALLSAARAAFSHAHSGVLASAAILMLLLAVVVCVSLKGASSTARH